MADRLTPEARSRLMAKVRNRNTRPEIIVRRVAHALGYRFRLHRRDLPGTPDLVFPSRRKVILVHGCFWHAHPGCRKSSIPKTNSEFWINKIKSNTERDIKSYQKLQSAGWEYMIIWECETINRDYLAKIIADFLC